MTASIMKHRPKRRYRVGGYWPYLFVAPFLIIYLVFNLFPILFSFVISLHNWDGISPMQYVGLQNYARILTKDPYFYKSLWNTAILTVFTVPFELAFGLLIAEFVFNLSHGRRLFQTINFLPYITTPVAIGIIFALIFDWKNGVVNQVLMSLGLIQQNVNWLGLAVPARFVLCLLLIWKYTGYHMILYLSGMSSIPTQLYEAARIDGANTRQIFQRITVPMLKPISLFLVITDLIGSMQLFDEAKLLFTGWTGSAAKAAGGPDRACLTAIWYFYDTAFTTTTRFGYGAAIAYLIFFILIILSLISFKMSYGRRQGL